MLGAEAWAGMAVSASCLLGLGIGAAWGSRSLPAWFRGSSPLRSYGRIEVTAAVLALPLPWLFSWLAGRGLADGNSFPWGRLLAALIPQSLVFTVLGLGFSAMLAALPGKALVTYGVNALGALFGGLAAGFLLLPGLGVWGCQIAALALGLAAGLGALRIQEPAGKSAKETEGDGSPANPAKLGLAGLAGFFAAGSQVLLLRCLILGVGNSSYSLSLGLGLSLAGIVLGSVLARLLPRKTPVLALLGLGGLLTLVWVFRAEALSRVFSLKPSGFGAWLWGEAGIFFRALITAGPPLAVFSSTLPFLIRWKRGAAASLYAVNALAAALGALAFGALLLPRLGLSESLALLGATALGLALAFGAGSLPAPSLGPRIIRAGSLFLAVLLGLAALPRSWSFSRLNNQIRTSWSAKEGAMEGQLLYARDGLQGTVAVIHGRDNTLGLFVHGKSEASTYPGDVQNQKLLGHLPALLWRANHGNLSAAVESRADASDPELVEGLPVAVVVGWGTGMTSRALARHPLAVETLELNPQVVEASAFFLPFDLGFVDRGNMKLRMGDARLRLESYAPASLALITSDPFNPWTAGGGSLYSREYFELGLRLLAPKGVMAAWVPLYQMPVKELRRLIGTFRLVFPRVSVWSAESDLILTGSQDGGDADEAGLQALWEGEAGRDLAAIGFAEPSDLLAARIATFAGPDRGAPPPHEDFRPWLEFGSARAYGRFTVSEDLREMEFLAGEEAGKAFIRALLEAKALRWEGRFQEAVDKAEEARRLRPGSGEARDFLIRLLAMQGWSLAAGGQKAAVLALYRRVEGLGLSRQDLLSTWGSLLAWAGYAPEARGVLFRALKLWPGDIQAWHALGDSLAREGRVGAACLALAEALRRVPYNGASWYRLAQMASKLGQEDLSREAFLIAVGQDPQLKAGEQEGRVTTGAGESGRVRSFQLPL